MFKTIWARLRGTLTDAEWEPLHDLRWKMTFAAGRSDTPQLRVHYYGNPRDELFAIVGTREELSALLAHSGPAAETLPGWYAR